MTMIDRNVPLMVMMFHSGNTTTKKGSNASTVRENIEQAIENPCENLNNLQDT